VESNMRYEDSLQDSVRAMSRVVDGSINKCTRIAIRTIVFTSHCYKYLLLAIDFA
jgi:hypothetical protein